jgi:hypothetical protein
MADFAGDSRLPGAGAADPNDQPNPANPGGISNNELARRQAALRAGNSGYSTPAAQPPADTRTAEQKAVAAYQHGNVGGASGAYNAGPDSSRAAFDATHAANQQPGFLQTAGRVALAAVNPVGTAAALGAKALGAGAGLQTAANVLSGPTGAATVAATTTANKLNGNSGAPAAPTGQGQGSGQGSGGMPTSPAAAGIAPPSGVQGLPGAAPPATFAPASADYSRYDAAAQDLKAARDVFNSELTRLSGTDPFGNVAFMQKATDRAVAQAAGTAAMAHGGAAAQAGALRSQQGVQSQLASRGIQDMEQQKAQDANASSGLRLQAANGIAGISGKLADNEVQFANQAISQAEINLKGALGGRELDQRERESLRNVATEVAKIDMQRYQTDVQYRENVNDNLAKKYASDSALQGMKYQTDAGENLSPDEWLMGLMGMGAGLAQGAIASDRRAKFNIHDPDLRDLQDYLGNSRGKLYNYRDPGKPGRRAGLNFGPMAQDLQKSKIGRTLVINDGSGTLKVDTQRLALADHAALAALAADVAKLKGSRK